MVCCYRAPLVDQTVKNLPAMQDTWVQSQGQNDLLEKAMETHSNILTWRNPWTEEPGKLQSLGLQRVWQGWAANTSTSWIVMLIGDSKSIKDFSEMFETFHSCALQILSASCLSGHLGDDQAGTGFEKLCAWCSLGLGRVPLVSCSIASLILCHKWCRNLLSSHACRPEAYEPPLSMLGWGVGKVFPKRNTLRCFS